MDMARKTERKGGRQKGDPALVRSHRVPVVVTEAEKAALQAASIADGTRQVSTWLRELGEARARKLGIEWPAP